MKSIILYHLGSHPVQRKLGDVARIKPDKPITTTQPVGPDWNQLNNYKLSSSFILLLFYTTIRIFDIVESRDVLSWISLGECRVLGVIYREEA